MVASVVFWFAFGPGLSLQQQKLIALLAVEAGLVLVEIRTAPNDVAEGYASFMNRGLGDAEPWSVDAIVAAESFEGRVPSRR